MVFDEKEACYASYRMNHPSAIGAFNALLVIAPLLLLLVYAMILP